MEMVFAQLTAVVAGADGQHALACGGADCDRHGSCHGVLADAIDHDLQAQLTPSCSRLGTRPRNVGQKASEVDAFSFL